MYIINVLSLIISYVLSKKDLTMPKKSVKLYVPENMLDAFYDAVRTNKLKDLHIPHSSVFYVRAAIEADTGVRYTLKHVENAMKHEGMLNDV